MTKKILLMTVTTCLLALSGPALGATEYEVDPNHSYIGFRVRHMTVTNVRGEFTEFTSRLIVVEGNLAGSSIEIHIDAASIDTRLDQRDEHLRSSDFLDVANHPEIIFKSTQIEQTGDHAYLVIGDLTIRGATQKIELPVTLAGPIKDPHNKMRLGVEGEITINRQDYGVSFNRPLDTGGFLVGNDVMISFAIEAVGRIEE